jgi:hypothetical protein
MDRDATLLLALGMLVVAAAAVGVSGWVLFLRERRVVAGVPARAVDTTSEPHPEAREGS